MNKDKIMVIAAQTFYTLKKVNIILRIQKLEQKGQKKYFKKEFKKKALKVKSMSKL